MNDPELEAMQAVATALTDLEPTAQGRVLEWASKRFSVPLAADNASKRNSLADQSEDNELDTESGGDDALDNERKQFTHFADLFDAFDPKSRNERALVGGYWLQEHEGVDGFSSTKVNNMLKDVGHPVTEIHKAYISLRDSKPSLVRQLTKSGKAKQARKTYKVTTEGCRLVMARISGE